MRMLTSPITAFSAALHLLVGAIVAYLVRAQGWEGLVSAGIWLLALTLAAPTATVAVMLAVRRAIARQPATVPKPVVVAPRGCAGRISRTRRIRAARRGAARRPLTRAAKGR